MDLPAGSLCRQGHSFIPKRGCTACALSGQELPSLGRQESREGLGPYRNAEGKSGEAGARGSVFCQGSEGALEGGSPGPLAKLSPRGVGGGALLTFYRR